MKKILKNSFTGIAFMLVLLVGCDVIKGLPTNTTGGLFSLNGSWKMESSSENKMRVRREFFKTDGFMSRIRQEVKIATPIPLSEGSIRSAYTA